MADILDTFKNLKFLLKFINLILVLICLIVWVIKTERRPMENGMLKNSEQVLYAHTVPAYVVILFVLVIAFFLDEEPGKWTSRLVLIPGAILFLATGIIAFVNYSDYGDSYGFGLTTRSVLTGILCVVVCVIMIVDILKTENVF